MKTSKCAALAVLLAALTFIGAASNASADDRNTDQFAFVMVTGSQIPQRVRIHPIGTKTATPIRVYNRREIDQTGRFTTEDVLAQDPALQVTHGVPGGGR